MPRVTRTVLLPTLLVLAIASLVGSGVVRWYARNSLEAERQHVRASIEPHANRVAAVLGQRIAQLVALKTFVELVRNSEELEREFSLFSAGLLATGHGLRAVEVVRDGRIVLVSPTAGNEPALGLHFPEHVDEVVRSGYARARRSEQPTIVGPVRLAQGGLGLLVFHRVRVAYDPAVELVELVIDLPVLLQEVYLAEPPEGIAVALRDRRGGVVASTHDQLDADPVTVVVPGLIGGWVLGGAPLNGWDAAVAARVAPVRVAAVTIVLLITLVAALLVDRDARLTRKVAARTASLAASEERLRFALAASRSATFEEDAVTGAVTWSVEAAAILGRAPTDTLGGVAELQEYLSDVDAQRVAQAFQQARQAPSQATFELRTTDTAGGARWVALHLLSRADASGAVRRVVGTLTDVTERRRLEEQFLHAQKMQAMGVLAGGIAHDFNNLLTVILSAGHMARASADEPGVPDSMRTDLDDVLSAGERAAVLTGQLLAFARRQVVQLQRLDLRELVLGMEPIVRRLVGAPVRVDLELTDAPVRVYADHGQLTQILLNLAINARDAMPKGGVVRVALSVGPPPMGPVRPDEVLTAEQYAVLEVSDTGTGIAPEVQPRIFDPFFTTKPVGQGTGLGLTTVYGIVRQCGGTVRFDTAADRGTTFRVYLPIDAEADGINGVEPVRREPGAAGERTILLAEGEASLRTLVARALGKVGYRVLVAEDGASAVSTARDYTGDIDLVISDVSMPGLGGVELARTLLAERPEMRVLLMSGLGQQEEWYAAAALRDLSFIAKPFLPSDLVAAVERALAAKR